MSATSNPAVIQPISSSLSQLLFLFLINAFTVAPRMRAPAIIDNIIFFLLLLLFQREIAIFVHFSAPAEKSAEQFSHQSHCNIKHTFYPFFLFLFRHHCLLCFHIRKILKIMGVCFYFSLIFNQPRFLESGSLRILDFITSLSFSSLPYTQEYGKYGSHFLFFLMICQLSNMRMGVPLCISATAEKCLDDFRHQDPCNIKHTFYPFILFLFRHHCLLCLHIPNPFENMGAIP